MRTTNKGTIAGIVAICLFAWAGGTASASDDGAKLFKKKCGICHTVEPGKHKVGPSLAGVLGRQAGSTDFPKYKALSGADFAWDEERIDKWITDPKKFIGKSTSMTGKVRKEDDREAIIEFLKGAS